MNYRWRIVPNMLADDVVTWQYERENSDYTAKDADENGWEPVGTAWETQNAMPFPWSTFLIGKPGAAQGQCWFRSETLAKASVEKKLG